MIEKRIETATIDVQPDGSVVLRERVAIVEDGEEISHQFTQRTIRPGDDLSEETDKVRRIAEAARA